MKTYVTTGRITSSGKVSRLEHKLLKLAISTFMYGSEVWVTTKAQERRGQVQATKILRRVKGHNRRDTIRSENQSRTSNTLN